MFFIKLKQTMMKLSRTAVMKQFKIWKSEVDLIIEAQKEDEETGWYWSFAVRAAIYGYILFRIFQFLKRRKPKISFWPKRKNINMRKLQRLV